MVIRVGEAVSLSAPENFKIQPDDRQTIIATENGNVVQDYGHIASGDRITFSAIFLYSEFMKLWDYFNDRTLVTLVDHNGVRWEGMRVRIISYGYQDRFEEYINVEMEFWRI